MFETIVRDFLLSTPGQALLIKMAVDLIKGQLLKLDTSKFLDNYAKYVNMAVIVLSGLVTFLQAAAHHNAASFDFTPLVTYFVTLCLATMGAHKTIVATHKFVKRIVHDRESK